jgi:hypothetical protein
MESIWPGPCHTLASIEPALRAWLHHERPPKTLPLAGPCSLFSRSRSVHSPSILLSILSKSASAEAVEIPTR